ncbi:hypothetical protein ACFSZS_30930 [Seohaeicola zhoushanensis]
MGLLATGYHPTEYPINNLVPNTTIQMINFGDDVKGREAMAFASALTEYTFFHCPGCNDEFKAQNQVFTSIASTSAYYLMCNKPIGSADALAGLRMRAPSNWARWTAYVGGNPVSITLGEMNEGMSQGVLDCLVASAAELVNWNLTSLVTDIAVGVPGGVAAGAPVNINRDTWQALSAEERSALMKAGAYSQAQYAWAFQQAEAQALDAAKAAGAKVADADASIVDKTKEFVVKDTAAMLEEVASSTTSRTARRCSTPSRRSSRNGSAWPRTSTASRRMKSSSGPRSSRKSTSTPTASEMFQMQKTATLVTRINRFTTVLGGLAIALMMLHITADVAGRYLFNTSLPA